MGLDLPELDDREYEELVAEATKLIPAYAEEWTDFNPHDPGITIVEVLAWLTSSYVYQLDQVTPEHRRKYVRLMGERLRPPSVATARLQLDPPPDVGGARVPAGTGLIATDGSEAVRHFETDHDVVLTTAEVACVRTHTGAGVTDNTHANEAEGMFYRAFGDRADRGDALYLGFDGDPFERSDALTLTVAYHDDNLAVPASHGCGHESFDPSVELDWQGYDDGWVDLEVAADATDALYGGGPIELVEPTDWDPDPGSPPANPAVDDGLVWLRCRIERSGHEIPPQFDAVAVNRVAAAHRTTVTGETLEQRSGSEAPGLDGQTYRLRETPVRSADVWVDGERWTAVPDFHASGPDDSHYVLDGTAGTVRFGDGVTGAVPPADATVVADYVAGGGDAGNVPASAVWQFEEGATCHADHATAPVDLASVAVDPLEGASGGAEGETVDAALRRLRRDLRRPYRAVTLEDFEHVATHTAGLRIGRTNVLTDRDAVTVVVVPHAPPDVPRPAPSEGFIDAVREHLDRHRLVTDRVRVRAPTYVGLEVEVSGRASDHYLGDGHERAVRTALEEFLHPLHGADGDGWPFGRSLVPAELAERLSALDALDHVADVSVTAHGGGRVDAGGTVEIDDASLFHVEAVATDLAAAPDPRGGER